MSVGGANGNPRMGGGSAGLKGQSSTLDRHEQSVTWMNARQSQFGNRNSFRRGPLVIVACSFGLLLLFMGFTGLLDGFAPGKGEAERAKAGLPSGQEPVDSNSTVNPAAIMMVMQSAGLAGPGSGDPGTSPDHRGTLSQEAAGVGGSNSDADRKADDFMPLEVLGSGHATDHPPDVSMFNAQSAGAAGSAGGRIADSGGENTASAVFGNPRGGSQHAVLTSGAAEVAAIEPASQAGTRAGLASSGALSAPAAPSEAGRFVPDDIWRSNQAALSTITAQPQQLSPAPMAPPVAHHPNRIAGGDPYAIRHHTQQAVSQMTEQGMSQMVPWRTRRGVIGGVHMTESNSISPEGMPLQRAKVVVSR